MAEPAIVNSGSAIRNYFPSLPSFGYNQDGGSAGPGLFRENLISDRMIRDGFYDYVTYNIGK
jgi:hypothetical protein